MARVVWIEYRLDNPRAYAGNATWRLMLMDIATGATEELGSGVHTRISGASAAPPIIRVDGDRVVYAVEHTRPGHPFGWRVVLQSVVSRDVEREFYTELDVYKLDLSGSTIVFSEGQNETNARFVYDMRLMLSTADHPEPFQIASDAYRVSVSGDRFAWDEDRQAGRHDSPVLFGPVIMTATVADPTPRQISVTTQGPQPPDDWGRPMLGGELPAVAGDLVAWRDLQTDGTWDGDLRRVVIWDARTEIAHQIDAALDPYQLAFEGGWLTWYTFVTPDGEDIARQIYGLPLSDLPLVGD